MGAPWLTMMIVLASQAGTLALLRVYQRRRSPHPELVRKLFHVGGGLTALPLPWLFDHAWPVTLLAAAATVGLAILDRSAKLRGSLGAVVHGVERESFGDISFPSAVAVLFVLAEGEAVLYVAPLLTLTLADPAAAFVGMRYGRLRYGAIGEQKSLEGSSAFFAVALLCVYIPLRLFTRAGVAESFLVTLTVGLTLTLVEAVSRRGLDNLFIPVAGFAVLKMMGGLGLLPLFGD